IGEAPPPSAAERRRLASSPFLAHDEADLQDNDDRQMSDDTSPPGESLEVAEGGTPPLDPEAQAAISPATARRLQEANKVLSLLTKFRANGRDEDLREAFVRLMFGEMQVASEYQEAWAALKRQLLELHTIANSGPHQVEHGRSRAQAREALHFLFKNDVPQDSLKHQVDDVIYAAIGGAKAAGRTQEQQAQTLSVEILPVLYRNLGVPNQHLSVEAIMKRYRRTEQAKREGRTLEEADAATLRRRLNPRKYGSEKRPKPAKP
ncbi:MAG TPA: hypothetical protein VNG33_17330, partial [Polyangiaceae bacterium]|nr:hypothetical protein [Polyangiaceae bacterium]